ncbi:hypothetical protein [Aureibacter tunicatorum]|uniref:Uncharacterized protein n=1 Tax=Aureibacter tunicatorum TaxID=866807 RepID=A0AAE4BPV0_9BACT|nr:hypothetical protein [Aureibacter tunicatorum]MDR6238374.1 hypothetical protein [Aureibacter tunicatorum]BDD03406.1 hypothetical protein AUTU_08890 [Aureibacter tunicatorum]
MNYKSKILEAFAVYNDEKANPKKERFDTDYDGDNFENDEEWIDRGRKVQR